MADLWQLLTLIKLCVISWKQCQIDRHYHKTNLYHKGGEVDYGGLWPLVKLPWYYFSVLTFILYQQNYYQNLSIIIYLEVVNQCSKTQICSHSLYLRLSNADPALRGVSPIPHELKLDRYNVEISIWKTTAYDVLPCLSLKYLYPIKADEVEKYQCIPSKHITFVQCWTNVKDIGPTLYKCFVGLFMFAGLFIIIPWRAKLNNSNFHPLEAVFLYLDPQLWVGKKYLHMIC